MRYVPAGREKEFVSYRRQAQQVYIATEWNEVISHEQSSYIAERKYIMNDKTIKESAVELTVEITAICDNIKGRSVFVNQLLRSCSSIGANSYEAKYAQSNADFINKMEIALKECFETEYWLEILFKVNSIDEIVYKNLINKCGTIRRKLIASVTTAKGKHFVKNRVSQLNKPYIDPQKYGFIYELEDFFKKNNELLYSSLALKENRLRNSGKKYDINEHCKALILSKLSNRQKWQRIEQKLDKIQDIFFHYDHKKILECDENYFVTQIKNIKCGSQVTDRDFRNLHQNIRILIKIERQYGSIDAFFESAPAYQIVEKLSSDKSDFKMKTIGPALAWEYLRNVGIDGAKPDVHLKRILGSSRLHLSNNEELSDEEFYKIMSDMHHSTNKLYIELDNYLWSYCADGQAEICTADPKCSKCVIKKYCNKML